MTLCIAAISYERLDPYSKKPEPHIVTVSDTMISGAIISADSMAIKIRPFHQEWAAMFSAEHVGHALSIIAKAEEYFKGRKNTLSVARSVFKRAFQRHTEEIREDVVLSTYGMTMDEFKKTGKRRFTESKFAELCTRIEQIDPECSFIVDGYDQKGEPHLFRVDGIGVAAVCDIPGFCCIGSGQWAADLTLYALKQSLDRNLNETIFNLCAAKFMAEKRGDVGQATFLHARKPGSLAFSYVDGMIEVIRDSWEKHGCPKVPDGIVEELGRTWHPRCK